MNPAKVEHLGRKIITLILALFVMFFMIFACTNMNATVAESVVESRWVNTAGSKIQFYIDYGQYTMKDSDSQTFTFIEKDGFVQCTIQDSGDGSLLELNRLSGNRLFDVTENLMFYKMA